MKLKIFLKSPVLRAYYCSFKIVRSHYFIIAITIILLTLPSIVMENTPFYHNDFVDAYASYIARSEYVVELKNPLLFWWTYGPEIPVRAASFLAIIVRQFIKDPFYLFVLLTKLNFIIQTIVAAFSFLLLVREIILKHQSMKELLQEKTLLSSTKEVSQQ